VHTAERAGVLAVAKCTEADASSRNQLTEAICRSWPPAEPEPQKGSMVGGL
jgi:hypothetical protein